MKVLWLKLKGTWEDRTKGEIDPQATYSGWKSHMTVCMSVHMTVHMSMLMFVKCPYVFLSVCPSRCLTITVCNSIFSRDFETLTFKLT